VGRNSSLSGDDSPYTAYLIGTLQPDGKEVSSKNEPVCRLQQEKRSVRQKRSTAVEATVLRRFTRIRSRGPLPAATSSSCRCYNPSDCIATNALWYFGNKQFHEGFGIPLSADQFRALTESFDPKIAYARNPLFRQLKGHLCRPRAH
jgi:hypothetical protein